MGLIAQPSSRLAVDSVAHFRYNGIGLNDIWGYVDSAGNEYALVGKTNGLSIVNVTDTNNLVEIFADTGAISIWRDIKTWGNYAYVTNESSGGLAIYDLSTLPDSVKSTTYFTGVNYAVNSAHNIYIDENGVAYLFGSNHANGSFGTIMLDVATNPGQPIELGFFDSLYLHDGYARGDTLYGSAVNDGLLLIIDVSNKSNPRIVGSKVTPNNFTHNAWLSDNSKVIFTTDEVSGAYIAAYDVSNPFNVKDLDRLRSRNTVSAIPHNTHVLNDFLVTSYYTLGLSIVDANKPDNLIEVGYYDTYPYSNGTGFNGNWGAYPFLPSGLILVSDRGEGLFVLRSSYKRASYLEGSVKDCQGAAIPQANITIEGSEHREVSNLLGNYKSGTPEDGYKKVTITANGYQTRVYDSILFTRAQVSVLNAELIRDTANWLIQIKDHNGKALSKAEVKLEGSDTSYSVFTDTLGQASLESYDFKDYSLNVSKWGYLSICDTPITFSCQNLNPLLNLPIGYEDPFNMDLGWTVQGNDSIGAWVRDVPIPTIDQFSIANPSLDFQNDCGEQAYVTGNQGGLASSSDLDGVTSLFSPRLDLSAYANPIINFYTWFYNSGSSPNDYLEVSIIDSSNARIVLDTIDLSNQQLGWQLRSYRIMNYVNSVSSVRSIEFKAEDLAPDHVLEVGIDYFYVREGILSELNEETRRSEEIAIYPNPFDTYLNYDIKESALEYDEVLITSAIGKVVYQAKIRGEKGTIELGPLPSGIYFVHFQTEQSRRSLKLIKH